MDNSKALGTEPIRKLLLQYSTPAVIGMLVQVLYTIIDSIFIGHFVGPEAVGAITLVFPIVLFSNGFGMLVGVGALSYIALLLGQRRLEDAEKTLGNAFMMIVYSTAVVTVLLLILSDVFISHSEVSPERREMARTFVNIAIWTGLLPAIMFGLNNIIRVQGNPRIAMGFLFLGFILNAIFNPIFVACFGWGVAGSALATALSQLVTATAILVFFRSSYSLLKLKRKFFHLDWKICRPVLLIGLAPFLTQMAGCLQGILLMYQIVSYGGDVSLDIWGVIHRTAMVIFMVTLGIYQGAQPIIGYNYSARQFDRVREVTRLTIFCATAWCVTTYLLVMLFPVPLARIVMELTPELTAIAPNAVRLSLGVFFILGFQVVCANYFQAVGKPMLSIFLSLTRQVIFLIPALLILPHVMEFFGFPGIRGIWCSFLLSDALAFGLTFYFFLREMRELRSGKIKIRILEPAESVPETLVP